MQHDSVREGTRARPEEEIRIEDLPNREATPSESEAAKGGYYSGTTGGIVTFGGIGGSLQSTSRDGDITLTIGSNGTAEYDEG